MKMKVAKLVHEQRVIMMCKFCVLNYVPTCDIITCMHAHAHFQA